jgi:hypothetical protein
MRRLHQLVCVEERANKSELKHAVAEMVYA